MRTLLTILRRLAFVFVLGGLVYGAAQIPTPRGQLPAREGPAIAAATSWGYQLQNARAERIAAGLDVLVIDSQRHESPHETLSPAQVERFQSRPDGRRRLVLAYLSVGEAESYRYYWWPHWRFAGPSWLGAENSDWRGNYKVRYWMPGWQRILIDRERSLLDTVIERFAGAGRPYLDRIIEAGFDGVYLDRVDAYYEWQKRRPGSESEMVALVQAISAYAKQRRPGFLIVPQNGEELLARAEYRRAVDAIAKEDLVFGLDRGGRPNPEPDVAASVGYLSKLKADGKPVFVVEYESDASRRADVQRRLDGLGFVLHYAERSLSRAPEAPPAPETPPQPPPPARPKGAG